MPRLLALWDGKPSASRANCRDFNLNQCLIWPQLRGGDGRHGGKNNAGMMSMSANPVKNNWSETQDNMGLALIEVGGEMLHENLAMSAR